MSLITRNLIAGISKLFPDAIFYKPTSSKVVSLTIDDVGGVDTLQILDAIDSFNENIAKDRERIRATFFVITDYLDDSKTMLDEILNRGHEIANHGQKEHRHSLLDTLEFRDEIDRAHEILSSSTIDSTIKWFRPGQAFYNDGMLKILKESTVYYDKFALASMLPLDTYSIVDNPNFTIKYISQFIFPGSILLLHGGTPKRTTNTVEVLSTLLTQLRQQEYKVVTLSELWGSSI